MENLLEKLNKDYENRTSKHYYNENNVLHRLDGPAIIHPNGDKEWWVNGQLHRLDGPAVQYYTREFWYKNGEYHRIGGPACKWIDGDELWYQEGKLHRLDGPAVNLVSKDGYKEWYFQGKEVDCSSQEEFERIIKLLFLL